VNAMRCDTVCFVIVAWPFCYYSKTGFWPSYCQISTDLGKILYAPIVVRSTLCAQT